MMSTRIRRIGLLICLVAFSTSLARAKPFVSLSPSLVRGVSGPTSLQYDVLLTNPDPASIDVDGFEINLDIVPSFGASPVPEFSAATTGSVQPYIFPGGFADTFNGGDIASSSLPTTSLVAGDVPLVPSVSVSSGATVGLGRLTIDVPAGFTESESAALVFGPGTNLSLAGGPVLFVSDGDLAAVNGGINLLTPEPASLLLYAIALPVLFWAVRWLRRGRNPAAC